MTLVSQSETPPSSPAGRELFATLASFYATNNPRVARVRLFGFDCLRAAGKVFVKLHDDCLVMKLPSKRIAVLTDSGMLHPYYRGGKKMKEWAIVARCTGSEIVALAEEARLFGQA